MVGGKTHSVVLFLVFFLSVAAVSAQDDFTSEYVEYRSYQLYLKKDWKQLLAMGDSALQQGVDYYYLRMRLGIAQYEQSHYLLAKCHFVKAIEFNSFEDLPKEYLFYCYFFIEHYEESRDLARTFTSDLKDKLEYKKWKAVDVFSIDWGTKLTTSNEVPNATYANVALGHFIANKVYFYHAYTFYHQGNQSWLWSINQNQYYLKASLPLKNDWNLALSFHAIGRTLQEYSVGFASFSKPFSTSINTSNFVESFNLRKSLGKFDYSVGSSVLWLDSLYQFQHDISTTYYPFANNKLALGAVFYAHTFDQYSQINFAAVPFISFKPFTKFSVYTSYLYNKGNNIAEWNGLLVNNSPDFTSGRFTLNSIFCLSKKWDLSVAYQYEMKRSTLTSNYNFNSFFISLKFKP